MDVRIEFGSTTQGTSSSSSGGGGGGGRSVLPRYRVSKLRSDGCRKELVRCFEHQLSCLPDVTVPDPDAMDAAFSVALSRVCELVLGVSATDHRNDFPTRKRLYHRERRDGRDGDGDDDISNNTDRQQPTATVTALELCKHAAEDSRENGIIPPTPRARASGMTAMEENVAVLKLR